MNFSELLGKYKKAHLNFNDMRGVTNVSYQKDNMYYAALNTDLYNLFIEAHFIDGKYNYNVLSKGYMDKDGIYMDLTELKQDLLKLFNIDSQKADEKLSELLVADDEHYEQIIDNSVILKTVINATVKYELEYKNVTNKTRCKNRVIKRYCKLLRNGVKLTVDLFDNEEKYVKVDENVFDENKLKLYMAYKVIKYSKTLDTYSKKYMKCADYLKDYLYNNYGLPHDSINFGKYTIEEVGKYYTEMYKKLCKGEEQRNEVYKELGINVNEVVDYDFDFFDFESLTKEEAMTKIQGTLRSNMHYVDYKEILERKLKLYKELPFTTVLKGKNKFEGYLGFVIDDKYVILDKFYNSDKSKRISIGNAIYIVSKDDFEELVTNSKKDAIDLISLGVIDAVRINHNGDYEQRVKNYIKYGKKYVDKDNNRKNKTKNRGSLGD